METMKFRNTIIATAVFVFSSAGSTSSAQILDSTKTYGPEIFTIQSKILGEKRKIRIQIPAGGDNYTAYPVLYVLDGEAQTNLTTGQVQYLSESYKIIPNMIVVGIDNTDRMRDLTPSHTDLGQDGKIDTSARSPFKNTGGGERFLQFIKDEVMPFVETRHKTAPYRILYGHSLGALMSVYCLVQHPDYFNGYIAISPSFQWDNKALLRQMTQVKIKGEKKLLFFSDANEDAAFHQNQLEFDSILDQKRSIRYKRMFYPDETHISGPVKAFYDGIRFVYPDWHLPYNSSSFKKTASAKIVREHYEALSKTYGYDVIPPHNELIQISRFLRNDPARIKDAIELLSLNAVNYPESPENLEILGDTYLKAGDKNNARSAYRRSASLDKSNESLKQKIKDLSE